MQQALVYKGELFHSRSRPRRHSFSQKMYYVSLNINDLKSAKNTFFGVENFNLLSFYSKDHGRLTQKKNKKATDLHDWARSALQAAGIGWDPAEVWLTSFPRVLGYVFNPISFWHCYDKKQNLRAIICEVNNTFGETHSYVLAKPELDTIQDGEWFDANKVFHVSPFFDVKGRYDFRFQGHPLSQSNFKVDILYYENSDDEKPIFNANFKLKPEALTSATTFKLVFQYPLLTLFVMANIHYQAFKIWRKKAGFRKKPKAPSEMFSKAKTKESDPKILQRPHATDHQTKKTQETMGL